MGAEGDTIYLSNHRVAWRYMALHGITWYYMASPTAAVTCTKISHRGQMRCTVSASRSAAAAQSTEELPSAQRAACGSLKRSAPKTFHSFHKWEPHHMKRSRWRRGEMCMV